MMHSTPNRTGAPARNPEVTFLLRTELQPISPAWPDLLRDALNAGLDGLAWTFANHANPESLTQQAKAIPTEIGYKKSHESAPGGSNAGESTTRNRSRRPLSTTSYVVLATVPGMAELNAFSIALAAAIRLVAAVSSDSIQSCAFLENVEGVPSTVRYQDGLNATWRLLQSIRWPAEQAGVGICLAPGAGGCFLSPPELREFLDGLHSHVFGAALNVEPLQQSGRLEDWLETLRHRARVLHSFPDGSTIIERDHAADIPRFLQVKRAIERCRNPRTVILDRAEQLSAWKS